ncbi:type I polyketide synthase [Bacillus pumilus]|uniref:Polyketide synthase n=1 Tax=Bacillus pumilus TaxID=1408 RepID=A0AAD0HKH0_BACPU|nr:type I polyketide synthase [Bacillus pumilus]AVM22922.1 polyketide synthase [Bacillus pumilus]TYS43375.1 SDR family NAD(P)-dependent oxidoreductase [Bacillus pumilus]
MSKFTGLEVAVVGMACRFPGAKNIHHFWDNLANGREFITFFSKEELLEAGVEKEALDHEQYVRAKGAVDQHDHFDADFFGYSQREAEVMDPQIRMFHEVAWESLEDAGYNPETYQEPIGLFGAASANLYWQAASMLMRTNHSSEQFAAVQLTDKDFMNTKVSYKLNLKGPSVAVDTACSSSLTAIHMAARALITGECKMALAGGVTITTPHKKGYMYQEGMIMSPDGHCRAFDEQAEGTVGGEGCGVVVLKSLKQALKDKDHIYGVIKGSAYNNDGGRKVGYTAPSIEGQSEVIKKALNISRVEAESISYIEAHGTGTTLGDPVEIESLKKAFQTDKKQFCAIGSVKTNIGHLDSAAGVAGFIKTALSLYHQILPPSLHYKKPNPKIDFESSPFYVNTTPVPWTKTEQPLRAGVSSFGVGGTNVHLIMEEAPAADKPSVERDHELMVISARSKQAVQKSAEQMTSYLKEQKRVTLSEAAFTLQEGRKHFPYRQAFLADPDRTFQSAGQPQKAFQQPAVVWMFSGQGAQYVNMGKDLYEKDPEFKQMLQKCFAIILSLSGVEIENVLYPTTEEEFIKAEQLMQQTSYTQIILFSFEYALASKLMGLGIRPHYFIGHSIGEITAACVAGIIHLEDAIRIVLKRGSLMQKMPRGEMAGVSLSAEEIEHDLPEGVELSAVNSSQLSVVSGSSERLQIYLEQAEKRGASVQTLKTSHAFHTSMMAEASEQFKHVLSEITYQQGEIPILSNVTGNWLTNEQASSPDYWASHIRQPVLFSQGLETLLGLGEVVFIEVGPGHTLTQFVKRHEDYDVNKAAAVSLVRHPKEQAADDEYMKKAIGKLWSFGVEPNWSAVRKEKAPYRVSLPTYPFEHQIFPSPQFKADQLMTAIEPSKKGERFSADFEDWFYIPVWERSAPVLKEQHHQGKRILVFEKSGHIGDYLKERYAEVVSVCQSDHTIKKHDQLMKADVHMLSHLEWVMAELHQSGFIPEEIIWMHDELTEDTGDQPNYLSVLDLVRLISQHHNTTIRLHLVSNQSHDVIGMENINPLQATCTGLALTIPQEYQHIACQHVDLCQETKADWPLFLSYEVAMHDQEAVVAYRGNSRWVRKASSTPLSKEESSTQPFRTHGVYLLTGGMGGIGFTLAQHLAETYQAKLVFLSRSQIRERSAWHELSDADGKEAETVKKLMTLEELGADVLTVHGDVSDKDAVQKAVQLAHKTFGDLHGVIHAAGEADGKIIQARTADDEIRMCQAKINGTYVLDEALKNETLDFVLLCSSLVSFLGAAGQVAYAASNAFMDSFAQAKRREGKPVISLNWDRWEKVGMAHGSALAAKVNDMMALEEQAGISPEEGIKAFQEVLRLDYPQILVSVRDMTERIKHRLTPIQEEKESCQQISQVIDDRLEVSLNDALSSFFPHEPDVNENFFEMGATSLDLLQMSGHIKSIYGIEVPVVMMYSHPTIASLAAELKKIHGVKEEKQAVTESSNLRKQAMADGKNRRKQRLKRK